MAQWDTGRVKAQLRLTTQRLGQLQDRMDSQARITQRDVATLLQQGSIALARAKAQKLIRDDVKSDLMQTLEMHIGVILGHLAELEQSDTPSPTVAEAASSIIYAGLQVDSKDLHNAREFIMQALGPDFTRSALTNEDNYVSPRVLRAVASPPPTAAKLDQYLYGIAQTFNVQWLPDLSPQQKVNALSPIVDPEIVNVVDLSNLRQLCSHGLPSHPPWLRPRVWRLLLGTLPSDKTAWRKESNVQRDNYYDLVRRLLGPLSSLSEPTQPLSQTDQSILDASNELSMVPPSLLVTLEEEPESCPQCPLDNDASEEIKITTAGNLDVRLRLIRAKEAGESEQSSSNGTPEIRLDTTPEIRVDTTPEIRFGATPEVRLEEPSPTKSTASESTSEDALSVPDSEHSGVSTTLLPSRHYTSFSAHNKHSSALLRLLYIHSSLNPANRSPHIGSLLVPIYTALVEEVDPQDVPHIEADAFWVFESMIGEFSELEDEQNGTVWVQKLSDRLRWADAELADDLATKGLDPGLPHYSFRWLIPLLTHTLPLPTVLMVWDALFSRPMRERDENPKLDYLVDICTSMLLSARGTLLQLGRAHRKQQTLWSDEIAAIQSTAFGERELEEAFIEGMAFLQKYPLDAVGGIEKVLQTAYDLALQRQATINPQNGVGGFGARLWKGISSSLESRPDEDDSEEETDEEDEDEEVPVVQSQQGTFSARLANTVWRGITNQSAMDVPSPTSSLPPSPELTPSQSAPLVPPKQSVADAAARGRNMIWGYAEKLKDSDAAATFAKVSTNWRVKALDVWSKPRTEAPPSSTLAPPPTSQSAPALTSIADHARSISLTVLTRNSPKPQDEKRGSMPIIDRSDNYSPPPRPAFFRPVRDSVFVASPISRSSNASPVSESGSVGGSNIRNSLSSSFKLPSDRNPSRNSTGPRPLLLNSASLITRGSMSGPASPARTPISPSAESKWVESVRAKRQAGEHRASQSSISSLSPSEPYRPRRVGTQSDLESDGGSRIVPINRNKSPSPMAQASRRTPSRNSISPPSPPETHRRISTNGSGSGDYAQGGWTRVEAPDSPATVPSPPPPGTPDAETIPITDVHVKQPESHRQRGSVVLPETSDITVASPAPENKLARRQATISRISRDGEASDSSATEPSAKNPNLRRKRFPPRLQQLRNSRGPTEPVPPLPSHFQTLDVPVDDHEHENATTPRANTFDEQMVMPPSPRARRRKISGGEAEAPVRTRKLSSEGRRRVSAERDVKQKRESAAVEGDDEGYNDLLSAYESEET